MVARRTRSKLKGRWLRLWKLAVPVGAHDVSSFQKFLWRWGRENERRKISYLDDGGGTTYCCQDIHGADVTLEDAQHQHGMKFTSQSHKVQFSRIRIQIKQQKLKKIGAICDLLKVIYEALGNLWALINRSFYFSFHISENDEL
jgi:hypothetical protein